MKLEHFLYGKLDGKNHGYRTLKTRGVHSLISEDTFNKLCTLDGSGIAKSWIPTEQVVARSYLSYTYDEWHRSSVWNHTILIPILDYIEIQDMNNVDKHFIRETDRAPERLSVLEIQTK